MRFRGTLVDVGILQRILQSLEKVDSKCILHLAPGKFNCIVRSETSNGLQAYAHLKADLAFENFTVESNSGNNIQFMICIETFQRAVKAANNAGELVMRLSKKNLGRNNEAVPCLTIDIELQTDGGVAKVLHDIPIKLISQSAFDSFVEPRFPQAKVEIYLPPLKILRAVTDKLKNITNQVSIYANMAGELHIAADDISVSADISFRGLSTAQPEGREADPTDAASVKLDLKKLARVLYGDKMQSTDCIACFHEEDALALHFLQDSLFTSYYIPLASLAA